MRLSIIVAAAENGVIGRGNKLPWHLPEDLKYFKACTMGKPIVMGRKTYESIGRPLPGRTNIVITRNSDWQAPGVTAVSTIEQALSIAESQGLIDGVDELFVIGGEQIYRLAMAVADRVYITRIFAEVEGDAWFPELAEADWQLVSSQAGTEAGTQAGIAVSGFEYAFQLFERRRK